jgi:hypothetical protein
LGPVLGLALAVPAAGAAWQDPTLPGADLAAAPQPQGVQVLTQGPIHEAFAEPVVYDPKPGPVIPKQPPGPVEEVPPDQRPEGANVQWIPGYWAWDDGRNDFVWVSGLWRDVPPGRQWVPGYWTQAEGGYSWVPGAWVDTSDNQVQYLPAPPASLEAGPSSPAPPAGAVWSPGYWLWQDNRYAWRPGFWVDYQPDWVWVPAHYTWAPSGYMFVDGYWDRPITQRGTPFAPVYFNQPVYQQPQFAYTPTVGLLASALVSSLFVRPAYHQYYFGDYYAPNYFQSGIYPWYAFHQSRYGYDPVFAHYATTAVRRDPNWLNNLNEEYRYRRDHPEARPPHTYAELRSVVNRSTVTNVTNVNNVAIRQNLVLARPLTQIAANPRLAVGQHGTAMSYARVDEARRQEAARQAAQLNRFREERVRQELAVARPRAAAPAEPVRPNPVREREPVAAHPFVPPERPRNLEFPRSPIVSEGARHQGGLAPPALPQHPPVDVQARPLPAGGSIPRPEPHPELRPHPFPGAAPGHEKRPEPPRPAQPKGERRGR